MASRESRSWPARRWLADRIVGDHAYSRNVAQFRYYPNQFWNFQMEQPPITMDHPWRGIAYRNPQETA